MECGPGLQEGGQDGRAAEELEARLRALAGEIEATGIPPHLEALARRLEAALALRRRASRADEAEAPPLERR